MTRANRFPRAITGWNLDDLCRSRKAQMPFSVVAVLILVLSSASIVLIFGMNLRNGGASLSNDAIQSMKDVASRCSVEFEQTSYGLAIDVVRRNGALNESLLHNEFSILMRESIATDYPKYVGGFEICINESEVSLAFLRMTLSDLYLELASSEVGGPAGWNMSTVPAYLSLSGTFAVVVTGSRGFLVKQFEIDRGLYVPVPLIANRLQAFTDALSGGKSEFENVVRYELSALAQDRALKGFGLGSMDGVQGTNDILTEQDVLNAINLALLLEQGTHIRSFDEECLRSFIDGLTNMGFSEEMEIVADLRKGGVLDPADLFLRLYDSGRYDLRTVLAEGLYAFADVLVLKWLDYFHVMDVLKFLEQTGDTLEIGLSEILGRMLNVDNLKDSAVNWIRSRLDRSGYPEYAYRYSNYDSPNAIVEVPSHRMVFFDELNDSHPVVLGGVYEVDFPSVDVFASNAWKAFYVQYKLQTFELADLLDSFVKSIVVGIASDPDLPEIQLSLDPRDRADFVGDLEKEVEGAILQKENWMAPALEYARNSIVLIDQMGESLARFIDSYWQEIFRRNDSVESAFKGLADRLAREACAGFSDFSDQAIKIATNRVYWEIKLSRTWGLRENVESVFDNGVTPKVQMFEKVFGSLESSSFLQDVLANIIRGAIEGIPNLEEALSGLVMRLVSDIGDCLQFRADRITITIPSCEGLDLLSEEGLIMRERLEFKCSPCCSLMSGVPAEYSSNGDLSIEIKRPWQYQTTSEYYPNRHITDFGNVTMTPYTSQWEVRFEGALNATLVSKAIGWTLFGQEDTFEVDSLIPFSANFTVVVSSCWPLEGVEYEPSATLIGGVVKFLENIWSKIADGVGFISHGVSKVFSFLQSMLSSLLAFSVKAVTFVSNVLQTMVEGVRGFFASAVSDLIGWVAESVSATFGSISFNMTIFGLRFSVETNALDLSLGSAKDMLKITFSVASFGAFISVSTRFVRLGPDDYDLLANATLGTERWNVGITIDPLMKLFNHFVEIKGMFGKHVLELCIPEVVQYEQLRLSLSDVPGIGDFLSNIPIPVPGAAGSIDAGLVVRYSNPFLDKPIINEYEQNPPGSDYDREWIEIFNPTNRPISMIGWTIETMHGTQRIESLGESLIGPYSYTTYVLKGQVLDNGGESKFPLSECAILRDPDGYRVDCTPWTTDYYNDGRTWQRIHDGADRWVFKQETFGAANSKKIVKPTDAVHLRGALLDCAAEALSEASVNNADLTSLGKLAQHTIDHVLDRCLKLLSDSIIEIRFYVEVSIHDISSSVSAGFTLSLVATGDFVEKALRWVGEVVLNAIRGLTNPYGAAQHTSSTPHIAEDVFVRVSGFGKVGLPRMVSRMAEGLEFRFDAVIEANMAFIGGVLGTDLGKGYVGFGVCISEIPGKMLPLVFGVDTNKLATLWVFKASIYET